MTSKQLLKALILSLGLTLVLGWALGLAVVPVTGAAGQWIVRLDTTGSAGGTVRYGSLTWALPADTAAATRPRAPTGMRLSMKR